MIVFTPSDAGIQITIAIENLDQLIVHNDLSQIEVYVEDPVAKQFMVTILHQTIEMLNANLKAPKELIN